MNDDLISAYIDGELESDKRMLVEHWLASTPGAKARLSRFKESDARVRLAVPRIATSDADPLAAFIMGHNAQRETPKYRTWGARGAALAAACIVGVFIGVSADPADAPSRPSAPLVLSADVQQFLNTASSNETQRIEGVATQVLLSVVTETGPCRLYDAHYAEATVETLACRRDGMWQMQVRALAPPRVSEGYAMASSNNVIEAGLAALGDVEALDIDQETAAIARDWRVQ